MSQRLVPDRRTIRGRAKRTHTVASGSCQPAKDGSDPPVMGAPRSIETRNKIRACMAHRWNDTKKETVLRIRLGGDQGRIRCLVALSKGSKLALIPRSLSPIRNSANFDHQASATQWSLFTINGGVVMTGGMAYSRYVRQESRSPLANGVAPCQALPLLTDPVARFGPTSTCFRAKPIGVINGYLPT
jgi:hypothetical protein